MSIIEINREEVSLKLADSCRFVNDAARQVQLGELSEESGVELMKAFCQGMEENTKDLPDVERKALYEHVRSHLVPSACAVFDQVIEMPQANIPIIRWIKVVEY